MDYRPALLDDIPWLTETFVGALRSAITAERGTGPVKGATRLLS